jgi:phosphate ABC transporter phosphate-binding protein
MIRTRTARRIGALLAAVALTSVGAGFAAQPAQASGAAHALIQGSGSSWAANAVNQWIADVQSNGLQVVFTANGSAQGRKDYANNTVDFAVSDIGYQGTDPANGQSDTSQGRAYAYLPIVAGGTSLPYQIHQNGQLVRNLRLSGETLAKIFTNQITNWDDPEITADNNGHQLPNLKIIPVVHSEGSGSTYQFTRYLATEFPNIWQPFSGLGATEYFPPPSGLQVAENGSDGVMNFVSSGAANGAIGYDEYSYALGKNYPVVKVLNSAGYYTLPNQYNVAVALTKAVINTDPSSPDYLLQNLDHVYVYNDPRVYPISSYSYMIIPTSATDQKMTTAKRQTLADYLYYSICQGQQQMGPIGYSPLPVNLVEAGFNQIAPAAQGRLERRPDARERDDLPQPDVRGRAPRPELPGQDRAPAALVRQAGRRSVHRLRRHRPGQPRRQRQRRRRRVDWTGRRVDRPGRNRLDRTARIRRVDRPERQSCPGGVEQRRARGASGRRQLTVGQHHRQPDHRAAGAGDHRGQSEPRGGRVGRAVRGALVVAEPQLRRHVGGRGRRDPARHLGGSAAALGPAVQASRQDVRLASRRRQRRLAIGAVLATAALSYGLIGLPNARVSAAPYPASVAASASAATKSKQVERVYYAADGTQHVQDKRTVSVTVDETTNLKSLQLVHLSWSGARPTGGLVADENSDLAQNEEYPLVLLECRGLDSSSAPAAQQIRPQTCWTQYADERYAFDYDSAFPAWRSDGAAPAKERAAFVDEESPAKQPQSCQNLEIGLMASRWVPFSAGGGVNYPGGPDGCAGLAPEATPENLSSLTLPSNETFGVTDANGKGQAEFDVFTAEDHASLGCSTKVPCSLVAVPVEGISCDPAGTQAPAGDRPTGDDLTTATADCETDGNFAPGEQLPLQASGAPAVDGALWWSASNWQNRITIPLSFAPADNVCGLTGGSPLNVYGSELMIQATTQWAPRFCLDSSLFNFTHVQTPEPEARSLLATGNIEAAFTSEPPDTPYVTPTVQAPVSLTGFGIAFDIDNGAHQQATHLNLDARLIAKLLTESYPDQTFISTEYPALANNPENITFDPEFQALNPGLPERAGADGAASLLALNTDSDVMYALTSYLEADPEARAWLNGAPDPWGMTVNPNYKGISLPTDNWPLLDSFLPSKYYDSGLNPCLSADPVPYLPLVASPTARLFSIGQDMEFAIDQSQTVCYLPSPIPGSLAGAKMVALGRQAAGSWFMLGVVSLGDASRENLQLASLETHGPMTATSAQFGSTAGRTFVAPDDASLRAAGALLQPRESEHTWPVPYADMRDDPADDTAYPGAMVVYADVPTQGLPAADAADYAKLLSFAAGSGQDPGTAQGQLPNGYLPLTAANGLGAMADYTQRAAAAVAAQHGDVPALVGHSSPGGTSTSSSGHSGSGTPVRTGGATGGGGGGEEPPPLSTPGVGSSPAASDASPAVSSGGQTSTPGSPSGSAPASAQTSQAAAFTPSIPAGPAGLVLPVLLGFGAAAGLIGPGLLFRDGRRRRR